MSRTESESCPSHEDELLWRRGGMEEYRCKKCGRTVGFTVSRPLGLARNHEYAAARLTVAPGRTFSAAELAVVRSIHVHLRDVPPAALREQILRNGLNVAFGTVREANEAVGRLAACGIPVVLEEDVD